MTGRDTALSEHGLNRADERVSQVLPVPTPGAPPAPVVPAVERFVLGNGLRVMAIPRRELPQVAARLVVPAGSAADPPGQAGVASLTAALLPEGTARLTAVELNERIDGLGASIGSRAGHDFSEIDLGSLGETFEEALGLLAGIVTDPVFPEREVERVRAEILDALDARLDEPANVADDRIAMAMFGANHPYGRLPAGTAEGVRKLRRLDLINFHADRYRPDGSLFVVSGDFNIETLRALLEKAFERWEGRVEPAVYPEPRFAPLEGDSLITIHREGAEQAEIRFEGAGIPRNHPDWIAASVANYIIGGSTITGRLGANLREDKGWTYGIRSGFSAGVQPAGWSVETAVDAAVADDAINEIIHELRRIITSPIEDEELERAREALVLSLPRAFETPSRVVARLATQEAYGLPADYWETFPARVMAVDREMVRKIATEHFDPARLARVVVRPPVGPR